MSMSIVSGSFQRLWVPVKDTDKIYVGGIVAVDWSSPSEGVEMLPVPSGNANRTNKDIPYGVVIGTNRASPLYDTTELCEYITGPGVADAHDGASIEYTGVEGVWAKGDPIAMVLIDLITPLSIIRAPIRATNKKTAPVVITCTTGDSNGVAGTFSPAIDFTPTTENYSTIYFRSGNNAGAYRVMDTAHTTVLGWDVRLRNDVAEGDTAVCVPIRTHGPSTIYFESTSMSWIDADVEQQLAGSGLWAVNVIRLDLSVPGQEFLDFTFQLNHFSNYMYST